MSLTDAAHNDAQRAGHLLTVRDLRVAFPGRRGSLVAIDGVSFTVAPGEVLGLVGESGAGKSMTGQAIIGLLAPPGRIVGGEIHLGQRRIDQLSRTEMKKIRGAKIGMVFQDPLTALNPLFPIGDQIIETIRTHKNVDVAAARARAIALLQEVGLPAAEERMAAYPHQLSGGMRQRVVIALALCADPELVIADEPTTALDVSVQAQVIAVLKRACAERGAAVVLITHDMGVIAETADRIAVMYAGRIVEIGPVADTIHAPKHPYTRGLMGTIPKLDEEADTLVQIPGTMPRLGAMPDGCRFHPRCQDCFDRCRLERPELIPVQGSSVACWLWDDSETARREQAFGTASHG
ncbi:MAG: ABC transporter ATP-binding protein [Pseudomonadota bacterium]